MNSLPLFVEQSYVIDGITVTGKEILDTLIENRILKEELDTVTK